MQRKSVLGTIAALAGSFAATPAALAATSGRSQGRATAAVPNSGKPLLPPAHGLVQVGFVVGPELVGIDLFGPWTAFGDAADMMHGMTPRFNMWTVGASTAPFDVDGGMKLQPRYSFANAPQPHVLVVPAQKNLPETIAWVKQSGVRADVVMSVCTGAFLVAKTGLFDGAKVTTHHGGYDFFEKEFPKVALVRGPRYVEDRHVSSSGGESSGIDLALRVVERYYGTEVANAAAYNMEYRRSARPQNEHDVG